MKITLFAAILSCFVFSLLFDLEQSAFAKNRKAKAYLSEAQAKSRRAQIKGNVSYDLNLQLESGPKSYSGTVTIRATLTHTKLNLYVDFVDGKVAKLSVNGKGVSTNKHYNGYFLSIPKGLLKVGENILKIGYSHKYSTTGNGLYRFVDPIDKKVYTYTNFEPYFSNHLFPNFDQPDLKGVYKLKVAAPKSWVVVSAKRESKVQVSGKQKVWTFPKTKPFSTYIFPLHAGDYHVWESKSAALRKIPMRLFVRQSLVSYVNPEDWFKVSQQGFQFFVKYFDYGFPFEKYDQLIVPDFNWGAMENVGAVTFSERYAPKYTPTREQKMRWANTLLHEMAHMWFGNLVTMKWWNDLWLNESFATYMANLALAEATEYKDAWDAFFKRTKQWAYWEDSLTTRHPITTKVPNTDHAFANFDGITYGKGASTLKQLSFFIGGDKFRDGMRAYFKKHEYGNTSLRDFMTSLARAAKRDLGQFEREWLQTSGTNRIEAKYTCKKGRIRSFDLIQTAPKDAPQLRGHRTKLAFHNDVKSGTPTFVTVSYSQKRSSVRTAIGKFCPKFVNLNHDDHDFVKTTLDPQSLASVKRSLSSMPKKLDRMMVWSSLWDMVENQNLSLYSYNEKAAYHLAKERDVQIVAQVLRRLVKDGFAKHTSSYYMPKSTPKERKAYSGFAKQWEDYTWERFANAKADSDEKKIWFDSYVAFSVNQPALRKLSQVVLGKLSTGGFKVDQERRWRILVKLSAYGYPGAEKMVQAEQARDKSNLGQKFALTALAAASDLKGKQKYLKEVVDPKSKLSLASKNAIMRGLLPANQSDLHKKMANEILRHIPVLARNADPELAQSFVDTLTPRFCSRASVASLGTFIKKNRKLPQTTLKPLKIAHQEDQKCVRVRARLSQNKGA